MGIEFTRSAEKHDVPKSDALFAVQNAVWTSTRVKVNDGDSRGEEEQ
jgi:hypothetical protein